jgi:hypothetical protein
MGASFHAGFACKTTDKMELRSAAGLRLVAMSNRLRWKRSATDGARGPETIMSPA